MNRFFLKLVIAAAFIQGDVKAAGTTQFQGEFTGIWTVGVPSANINPGDSFTWYYIYESDDVNGSFGMASPATGAYVLRDDIPGLEGRMDNWASGFLTVEGGSVVAALLRYEFDDPRTPPSVSTFRIDLESFRGFGDGTVTFADPVPVPEPSSLLLSLTCALVWRIMVRSSRAHA